jgi:hypothetical protein
MGDEDWMSQILTPVPESPPDAFEQSDRRSQRRWFTSFLVAGLVTGAAAVIGLVGSAVGYLVLDPLTRHVAVLLLASLPLLIVAAIVMPPLPTWGNVLRVLAVIGLSLVLAAVALLSALAAMDGESRYESPDGRSILVVSEGSDMIDPLWTVTVQQSSPVLARTWALACFNGDDPDNGLASIRWVSSTLIEAQAESGQTFQVAIDPSDSRPSTTVSVGCYD